MKEKFSHFVFLVAPSFYSTDTSLSFKYMCSSQSQAVWTAGNKHSTVLWPVVLFSCIVNTVTIQSGHETTSCSFLCPNEVSATTALSPFHSASPCSLHHKQPSVPPSCCIFSSNTYPHSSMWFSTFAWQKPLSSSHLWPTALCQPPPTVTGIPLRGVSKG